MSDYRLNLHKMKVSLDKVVQYHLLCNDTPIEVNDRLENHNDQFFRRD